MDTETSSSVNYARTVDDNCKNKCPEEKHINGDYLSSYVRKISVSISAFCIYYSKPLVYGSTGKKDLFKHVKNSDHLSEKSSLATAVLPHNWRKPSDKSNKFSTRTPVTSEWCTLSYGVVENAHATGSCRAFNI